MDQNDGQVENQKDWHLWGWQVCFVNGVVASKYHQQHGDTKQGIGWSY